MKEKMMSDGLIWQRIETKDMFCSRITGRHLTSEGFAFVIYADGRISGTVDGQNFTGSWVWRGGYFCREAELEGENLEADCEVIEVMEGFMRYTKDKGVGASAIVEIGKKASG